MIATKSGVQVKKLCTKVPEYLIYEIIDGKPIHYKGYREVMAGIKTYADITGSSTLQALIVTQLILAIGKQLNEDLFTMLSSEAGLHLDKRNNLAGDILIFDNATLPIEVDIAAYPTDVDMDSYIFQKTQKLLNSGVERVIWITTQAKKVTIASTHDDDWQIKDWHKDIEVIDGIRFNIGAYLTKKRFPYA